MAVGLWEIFLMTSKVPYQAIRNEYHEKSTGSYGKADINKRALAP